MDIQSLKEIIKASPDYCELRSQTNRAHVLALLNGDLVQNQESEDSGLSCRLFKSGGWGFASSSLKNEETAKAILSKAEGNASFMANHTGSNKKIDLPGGTHKFHRPYEGKGYLTTKEQVDFLQELNALVNKQFPDLKSVQLIVAFHELEKTMVNSLGSETSHILPRTSFYTQFSYEKEGEVSSLMGFVGDFGRPADIITSPDSFMEQLETQYKQVVDKANGVHAQGGVKDVIISPEVTGVLAHEAIGHPAEADLVKAGSVAGNYIGEKVASDLVTMVDYAHTYEGKELPVPVYIDDEGVEAVDAPLIEDGVFKGFMNNRELADHFGHTPTGNARAYDYSDEPLIRMRNTLIHPGKSKLDDMIGSIDDGYYFIQRSNGQADLTSEFMFGVTMGYEIKNGKLGKAIKDTTISGVAFDMLKTVDMVSDEMHVGTTGFCGKKQRMIVSHGGPSLKCRVHVGGR
jgi:TldD protein